MEWVRDARVAPLPPALSGEQRQISMRAGRLTYYVAGQGPPLLLIHSINAAGSAYEVRPIFESMRETRRVYAVDLPGFGASDRSDRRYDIALYVNAIQDMLDVIERDEPGHGVDVLAISLSCEFLARLAADSPSGVRSLTFVTPTGFNKRAAAFDISAQGTREIPGFHAFVSFKLWGQGLYNLLVSRRSIRFFLEKTFGSKNIDHGLLDYDYASTHQPGAEHAPFVFLSGRLFSKDIRSVYARLTQPIWMPHGTRGDFADFSGADWVRKRPNWTVESWPTGALPHFEMPSQFIATLKKFLSLQDSRV